MPQIISTLSTGVDYTLYHDNQDGSGMHVIKHVVSIKGGAGVARRGGETGILTRQGVVTTIDDDELSMLKANPVFQMHMKNGFVQIIESDNKVNVTKAVKDMEAKDKSAPLTEDSFKGKETDKTTIKLGKLE